jgi:hypothetical protein
LSRTNPSSLRTFLVERVSPARSDSDKSLIAVGQPLRALRQVVVG